MNAIVNTSSVNKDNEDDFYTLTLNIEDIWKGALLFLATLFSHWQALGGGFIWDDDAHVTRSALRSLQGIWDIWFKLGATQQYYPIVHSAFWLEQAFWGDNAFFYHLINIILHTVVSIILVKILLELKLPGAWIAGFIFALHPVHVESVAWITEQKNTISALFYLLAALFYIKYDDKNDHNSYIIATVFFVLALLSKTVTATLPAALLVLFWWKRGSLSLKKDVYPLIPWFILGIFGGIFTAWVEKVYIGAQGSDYQSAVQLTPFTRFLLSGHSIIFYLSKLLWPINLIFIYPHWKISVSDIFDYTYIFLVIIILIILIGYVSNFGRSKSTTLTRAPLAGFLFFCGTLFPVLGFANVYPFMFSYVADHFQYLASLGIIIPIASFLTINLKRLSIDNQELGSTIAGVFLALLGFLSWNQCAIYKDAETLYRVTIDRNPLCWMAHNNLGAILLGQGKVSEATAQFEQALVIRPDYPDARSNMCSVMIRAGKMQEALINGQEAVRLRPTSPENLNNLGITLFSLGRVNEAINAYQQALKLRPNFVEVLNNLGNALMQVNQNEDALKCYQAAIQYQPSFSDAYANLGLLLINHGNAPQGIAFYQQAIKLQPTLPRYHQLLGLGYAAINDYINSIQEFQQVLKYDQNNPDAWFYLGNNLVAVNRLTEAEIAFLNTLKLNPNNIAAENNLAAIYYRLNRFPEAISHYQLALRLNANYAEAHNNLGVVYVASKFYDTAIAEYRKATEINPKYGDAFNNWGLALMDKGDSFASINFFKKAISLNTNNPSFHDNLARAYFKLGKESEGKNELLIAEGLLKAGGKK
jgi:protein O-mannosyl-transferase